jgi:NADH-quinone oxidoreductase subunit F
MSKAIRKITVCAGTGCIANGALEVLEAFKTELTAAGLTVVDNFIDEMKLEDTTNAVRLSKSGCQGFCAQGPLVTIAPDDILYNIVRDTNVKDIVEKTIKNNEIIEELLYEVPATKEKCKGCSDIPFYKGQTRLVLEGCGLLDPDSLSEYVANGGYKSAEKVFTEMTQQEICKDVIDSGLRGRGGGGFPTGRKWEFARVQESSKKYIICNGDEGDPGAFMDRSVMEGNPHAVIEGMMIAAKAIGADEGYVYVRAEYPLAVKRIKKAIVDAEAEGILGENLFDTGLNFKLHVMEGAGAFVCGEETALIHSIEGKRGMPSPKPPFPAVSGLHGKPTIINNVETLATLPLIFQMGVEEFVKIGCESSKGTKTFAISGHVANTGLIEVPLGTTLREVVFEIGGGVLNDKGEVDNSAFKAVQIGGPSGGCLTEKDLDIPLDFDSLRSIGAMIGSGGLVVMNKSTCMIGIAKYFMQFTQNESCGKCVLCREGTKQLLGMLTDITEGEATMETLDLLKETAEVVLSGSLCGLGKTAPNPVLSTLKNFYDEYLAHVQDKKCPAGECKALANPEILDSCIGCTACKRACPVDAISGNVKEKHTIDADKCVKCGACAAVCKFDAIIGVS